jgi:REP element-mobilizing transposase RayT
MARRGMAEDAVILTWPQRVFIEQTIREHCGIRKWELCAVNARTNHVHLVVTADRDADVVMNQFKAWCAQKLSDQAGLKKKIAHRAGRKHWFTEGGDQVEIENEEHLANAIRHVNEGQ